MVGGQGHLGRADQVQVVLVQVVDVLRGLAEEAGAGHRLGRTSAGVSIGVKPAAVACAIAAFTRASSSSAPTPVRK